MKLLFLILTLFLTTTVFGFSFSTKDQVRLDLWYLGLKTHSQKISPAMKVKLPSDFDKQLKQL